MNGLYLLEYQNKSFAILSPDRLFSAFSFESSSSDGIAFALLRLPSHFSFPLRCIAGSKGQLFEHISCIVFFRPSPLTGYFSINDSAFAVNTGPFVKKII